MKWIVLAATALAACSASTTLPPTGTGTGFSLVARSPQVLGVGYGEEHALTVRYLDQYGEPITDGLVHFQIFGDPAGSTLSSDRAATDGNGDATVTLSSGAGEAQFHVDASATNAPEVEFDVSVSQYQFVTLSVLVDASQVAPGAATVMARLYDDRACASLAPSTNPPAAARAGTAAGPAATVTFPFLLAMDYAVAARVLDGGGRLVAWGCVDVGGSELAAGSATVPVPVAAVWPSIAGAWQLHTTLPLAGSWGASSPAVAWDRTVACPTSLAAAILDGTVAALGPGMLSDSIAARRADADPSGCRPAMADGTHTLDGTLAAATAGAATWKEVVGDLDGIVAGATVDSTLTLTATGVAGSYAGTHALARATVATPSTKASYDLAAFGAPGATAVDVPVTADGSHVLVGAHALGLRLPALWRQAMDDAALTPRGLPTTTRGALGAIADTISVGAGGTAVTGCAAVSALVCDGAGVMDCDATAACATALDGIAARLDATFAPPAGADLVLAAGHAEAVDSTGALVADGLAAGAWNADVAVGAKWIAVQAGFTGRR